MEIHQIRYFLALSRTLNFTRAAEECNVSQPALTRAIQSLEGELGSNLFARERGLTHLTDFGARMLPMLQQCYDGAVGAKALARDLKNGGAAPIRIALSRTINIALLSPALGELRRAIDKVECRLFRGDADEVADALKKGHADVAVAGPLPDWDRFDRWPLFREDFVLAVGEGGLLANEDRIDVRTLERLPMIRRPHCESLSEAERHLSERGATLATAREANDDNDVAALVAIDAGVALAPRSSALSARTVEVDGLALEREVSVYAVAGRPRGPATAMLLKMLRAADWRPSTGTAPN